MDFKQESLTNLRGILEEASEVSHDSSTSIETLFKARKEELDQELTESCQTTLKSTMMILSSTTLTAA